MNVFVLDDDPVVEYDAPCCCMNALLVDALADDCFFFFQVDDVYNVIELLLLV